MKKPIFAVKDRAIDSYAQPFIQHTTGSAIRGFVDEVNKPESPLNAHPEDYDLYKVGEWDDDAGEITGHRPELVLRAQDAITRGTK